MLVMLPWPCSHIQTECEEDRPWSIELHKPGSALDLAIKVCLSQLDHWAASCVQSARCGCQRVQQGSHDHQSSHGSPKQTGLAGSDKQRLRLAHRSVRYLACKFLSHSAQMPKCATPGLFRNSWGSREPGLVEPVWHAKLWRKCSCWHDGVHATLSTLLSSKVNASSALFGRRCADVANCHKLLHTSADGEIAPAQLYKMILSDWHRTNALSCHTPLPRTPRGHLAPQTIHLSRHSRISPGASSHTE